MYWTERCKKKNLIRSFQRFIFDKFGNKLQIFYTKIFRVKQESFTDCFKASSSANPLD